MSTELKAYQPGLANRRLRAIKIMELQIERGLTLDEACAEVGVDIATFRRWSQREGIAEVVNGMMQDAAREATLQISEALPAMIEQQVAIATSANPEMAARDKTNAFKSLTTMLQAFNAGLTTPRGPMAAPKPTAVLPPAQPGLPALEEPQEDEDEDGTGKPVRFNPQFLGETHVTITENVTRVVDQQKAAPE